MVQLSLHYFQKSHFLEPSPWPTFPQLLCLMLSASFSALDETEKSLLTEQVSEFPYANPACESDLRTHHTAAAATSSPSQRSVEGS